MPGPRDLAVRARRLAVWALALAGGVLAVVWSLPLEDVTHRCPPAGEGQELCELQKSVFPFLVKVVGGVGAGAWLAWALGWRVPELAGRFRRGEPLRRPRPPVAADRIAADPVLAAAMRGVGPVGKERPSRPRRRRREPAPTREERVVRAAPAPAPEFAPEVSVPAEPAGADRLVEALGELAGVAAPLGALDLAPSGGPAGMAVTEAAAAVEAAARAVEAAVAALEARQADGDEEAVVEAAEAVPGPEDAAAQELLDLLRFEDAEPSTPDVAAVVEPSAAGPAPEAAPLEAALEEVAGGDAPADPVAARLAELRAIADAGPTAAAPVDDLLAKASWGATAAAAPPADPVAPAAAPEDPLLAAATWSPPPHGRRRRGRR